MGSKGSPVFTPERFHHPSAYNQIHRELPPPFHLRLVPYRESSTAFKRGFPRNDDRKRIDKFLSLVFISSEDVLTSTSKYNCLS